MSSSQELYYSLFLLKDCKLFCAQLLTLPAKKLPVKNKPDKAPVKIRIKIATTQPGDSNF